MPRNVRKVYIDALPQLQAEEQLAAIEAASFSNMKPADQRSIQRRLRRMLGSEHKAPVHQASSPEEAAGILAGMGIALEVQKAS